METRKIKKSEEIYSSFIGTVSFFGKMSENYAERMTPPETDETDKNSWACFDGAGKMCSRMTTDDYKIHFDGHVADMCGVAGVATLPEKRNLGCVRALFETALPEIRERGFIFSYLYPFSYAFYRKFGYELCYARNEVTIPGNLFKEYPYDKNFTMYEKGDDISGYKSVYEQFARDKNLSFVRDDSAWESMVARDPYTTGRYAYLHRDASGDADAYVLFKVGDYDMDGPNTMRTTELAWTSADGLRAAFGFLGGYSPQFDDIFWEAPDGLNIHPLFTETADIKVSRPASGMNRIVNVAKALRLLRVPGGTGRAVLSVLDETLPVNSGAYEIEWENGASSVKPVSKAADLETDVQTLAQLATGFITPSAARLKRNVIINGNEAALEALFPIKELYLLEKF